MAFSVKWLSTLSIVSAVLLIFTTGPTADAIDPDSWDMVIADYDKIRFFKNDINIRNSTMANVGFIRSLAYSSANRTLYMSNSLGYGGILSSCNLDEEDLIARPIPVCSDQDPLYAYIYDMDFDPVTNSLFWNDFSKEAILRMNIASDGSCNRMEKVVDVRGMRFWTMALDICNRFIYWVDQISENQIGRARLDGIYKKEIVGGTEWPLIWDMAVDNYAGKLYFVRIIGPSSSYCTIEESNLDGTDRRVLVNDTDTTAARLAVDETAVYWTEDMPQKMWKVYKNGSAKHVVTSSAGIILTRGNADCKRGAESDAPSSSSSPPPSLNSDSSYSYVPLDGSPASSPSSPLESEIPDSDVPSNGSSTLPGVDPMVILLPQALAIVRFLYRQTRIGLW